MSLPVISACASRPLWYHSDTDTSPSLRQVAVAGGLLACPTEPSSEVTLLDLRSGREAARLAAPAELGTVMALCPVPGTAGSGTRLVAVYESGALLLWDPAQPRLPADRLQVTSDTPMCVDVTADGRGLVGTSGCTVPSFSVTDCLQTGSAATLTSAGVSSVRLRGDGRLAALGCWDGRVRLVSGRRLKMLAALDHHTTTVECVQFASWPVRLWKARALLASGSADGTAALWKVYDDS